MATGTAAGGSRAGQRGQAAVETVAAIPLLLVTVAVAGQLVLVGWSAFAAAHAARAGARAELIGSGPASAARRALPGGLREGVEVRAGTAEVEVRVEVPRLLPLLPKLPLAASSDLDAGAGDPLEVADG